MRNKLADAIGCAMAEPDRADSDNIAIVLCTYFNSLPECPDDQEDDEDTGWKPWVIERVEVALVSMAEAALQQEIESLREEMENAKSNLGAAHDQIAIEIIRGDMWKKRCIDLGYHLKEGE